MLAMGAAHRSKSIIKVSPAGGNMLAIGAAHRNKSIINVSPTGAIYVSDGCIPT